MTKILNDYDEKYMKIKFTLDDELPLNKMTELPTLTIVLRAAFYENNKYNPEAILDECLYRV